jgi:hypothetical protein
MKKIINFLKNLLSNLYYNIKDEIIMEEPQVKPAPFKKFGIMRVNSKHTKVLNHLIEKGSIDLYVAKQLYGVTRLPSIIHRLRGRGYKITSVPYINNSVTYIYNK